MSISKKKLADLLRLEPKRPYTVKHPILRKKAQQKGGNTVSKDSEHMKRIGRMGGHAGGGPHRKPGTPWVHHGLIQRVRRPENL